MIGRESTCSNTSIRTRGERGERASKCEEERAASLPSVSRSLTLVLSLACHLSRPSLSSLQLARSLCPPLSVSLLVLALASPKLLPVCSTPPPCPLGYLSLLRAHTQQQQDADDEKEGDSEHRLTIGTW